jgi:pyruvate formate lyase activating enzyme
VRSQNLKSAISEENFFKFLKLRLGQLEAVVITGGEPTLQKDLLDFIRQIKKLGFLVKLDTNGSRPDVLEKALDANLVDYLAMDIKAPLEKYKKIAGKTSNAKKIKKSIQLVIDWGKNYEFRTTVVRSLLTALDILKIGREIRGAKKYVLQKFIASKVLDHKYLSAVSYSESEFQGMRKKLQKYVKKCVIR